MSVVQLAFLIVAAILFIIAATGVVPISPRYSLIAGGLAFWVGSEILGRV